MRKGTWQRLTKMWRRSIERAWSIPSDVGWDLEPHLTNAVRGLERAAREDGDAWEDARLVRHTFTFPTVELARLFSTKVPPEWRTRVGERDDGLGYFCECTRICFPIHDELKTDARLLWTRALEIHHVLSPQIEMHHKCDPDDFIVRVPSTLVF